MSKMSVFVKGALIAAAAALALSSVAFAARGRGAVKAPAAAAAAPLSAQVIQSRWTAELSSLKFESVIVGRLDRILERIAMRFDKDVKRPDDELGGKLERTFNAAQILLGKAQSLATTHAGFDASGKVTDQAQALKSVQSLGALLAQLRGVIIFRLEHFLL